MPATAPLAARVHSLTGAVAPKGRSYKEPTTRGRRCLGFLQERAMPATAPRAARVHSLTGAVAPKGRSYTGPHRARQEVSWLSAGAGHARDRPFAAPAAPHRRAIAGLHNPVAGVARAYMEGEGTRV